MRYLLTIIIIISSQLMYAQDTTYVEPGQKKQAKSQSNKIYYGGNIGLALGSYTMIGFYPMVGYKITPKLSSGVKLAYEYIKDSRYATSYSTSNYGASVFARYRIIQPLYIHLEYAGLNYEIYDINGESQRQWVPFLFAGAGYSQRIGSNVWLNAQILFDVLQSSKSPYRDWEPFYSIGVGVGF